MNSTAALEVLCLLMFSRDGFGFLFVVVSTLHVTLVSIMASSFGILGREFLSMKPCVHLQLNCISFAFPLALFPVCFVVLHFTCLNLLHFIFVLLLIRCLFVY